MQELPIGLAQQKKLVKNSLTAAKLIQLLKIYTQLLTGAMYFHYMINFRFQRRIQEIAKVR